jgi:hypothetical protein
MSLRKSHAPPAIDAKAADIMQHATRDMKYVFSQISGAICHFSYLKAI